MAIARYAGVPLQVARDAVELATIHGLLHEGKVDPDTATRLIAEIPPDQMGEIHAAIARHLLSEGPEFLHSAVHHLEIAGQLMPQEELVELAEQGGCTALFISNYQPARQLLALAEELDPATNPIRRATRLRDLSAALHRMLARSYGESISAPGWVGADLLLGAEELLGRDDPSEMAALDVPEDFPALANPIGRLAYAFTQARTGSPGPAESNLRIAIRQLDKESSYLLVARRAAALFEFVDAPDVAEHLIEVLSPWAEHFAVDSNAWWCDGPVALGLGILHLSRGRADLANDYLSEARTAAQSFGDIRSVARINRIHRTLPSETVVTASPPTFGRNGQQLLTQRERQILDLMCAGATNREIAGQLAFSLSTIRADTTAIYRKLGVKGRSDAVAIAISTSLSKSLSKRV